MHSQELEKTIKFVFDAHSGQTRKDNLLPYFTHPMDVMKILTRWGVKDLIVLKAALAHDIREESPHISVSQIEENIGAEACKVVEELTFIPEKESTLTVAAQKDAYLQTFKTKSAMSLLVKLADRVSNTRDFMINDFKYAKKYWLKASQVFESFEERFDEIQEIFGKDVCNNIDITLCEIIDTLDL